MSHNQKDAALAAPAAKGGTEDVRKLAAFLSSEIDGLISESDGVAGLHQNGDIATWEELLPGGKYERLTSLDDLRHALTVIVPPAGAAGGGSGDLGARSAGADKDDSCILCCNGAELPLGEECQACGRTNKTGSGSLRDALDKLEGPMSPPTTKVAFAAPTPDLGAQGEPVAEILKLLREGFNSDDTQTKNWSLQSAHDKLASLSAPVAPSEPVEEPVEFDAGYLPNSGRDADQWHDAIRQLLASAHDHYVEQFRELAPVAQGEPVAKHHGAAVIAGLAELIPLIDDLGAVAMGFVQSEPTPDKAKLLMGAIDRLLHKRDTLDFDEAPAAPRSGSGVTVEGIAEAVWSFRWGGLPDASFSEAKKIARSIPDGAAARSVGKVYAFAEKLSALIQAPHPGETGDGWEPIETAPKDGTQIVIYRPSSWQEEEQHVVSWDEDTAIGAWWVVHDGKNDHLLRGPDPTHWRLPFSIPSQPRPAAQAGDGGGA